MLREVSSVIIVMPFIRYVRQPKNSGIWLMGFSELNPYFYIREQQVSEEDFKLQIRFPSHLPKNDFRQSSSLPFSLSNLVTVDLVWLILLLVIDFKHNSSGHI